MRGYPSGFRKLLFATMGGLIGSGVLLIPTTLDLRLAWNMAWRLSASNRTGVVALHVALGFITLMILGALWSIHMRAGWRHRRNHRNGALLVLLLLTLAVSGLGIFYLVDEDIALADALSHTLAGVLLPIPFIYHYFQGRKILRRRAKHIV